MTQFIKKNWVTGEVITESDMDRLEGGVQDAFTTATAVDIVVSDHINDLELHLSESDRNALDTLIGYGEDIAVISDITKEQVGLSNVENILNNYAAVTDPLTTSNGYNIGSIWVNTSNDKSYICVDNTNNAVVWKDITASGSVVSGSGTGVHNDLTGIQGGAPGNYYHLTAAQSSALISHLTDYNNPHQTATGGGSGYVELDALGYLERDQIPKCNLRNIFNEAFTSHATAENNSWRGLCWSPDLRLWCAVSTNGRHQVMTSPDGLTWTARSASNNNYWADVCWSPSLKLFVAVSYNVNASPTGVAGRVMTSPDGITWTSRTAAAEKHWTSIVWSEELQIFVALAYFVTGDPSGTNLVMTSDNGIDWTIHNAACEAYWEDVCWSPELELFVAVAGGASAIYKVMTSSDGVTWTGQSLPSAISSNQWGGVAWSPSLGMFAAVSYTGTYKVMTSVDGINWTPRTAATTNNWYKIIWSPEFQHFVACSLTGVNNRIMYSRDGISWYSGISAADNSWYTIGYSTTLAQVVCLSTTGTGNRCMVSPDVMDYAIDGDYAKSGQFKELYIDTYPALSAKENIKSINSTYSASVNDRVLLCNGTFTINLPSVSSANGITYVIKNIGTGTITIDGNASETIDGATTKTISSQYNSVRIVCNGSAWFII
jgi:hypothetical protein